MTSVEHIVRPGGLSFSYYILFLHYIDSEDLSIYFSIHLFVYASNVEFSSAYYVIIIYVRVQIAFCYQWKLGVNMSPYPEVIVWTVSAKSST